MAQEYQIKLSGRLQQGRAPDMALQLLSDLFQVPAAEGTSYFQGRPTTLPRKLDQATAEQLCHRFRNVGVECSSVVAEELDYKLELIQEGPEATPSQTTTTAENELSAKLQDLTQQLAASEDGLTDSAFVLELIPLEEELTKPLPKVGHIHIPTASPALKQMHGQQQTQGQEQGQTAGESEAQAAGEASAQTPASPSEGGSGEGSDEVIAIGQAMVSGGGAGLGGMLPQASVQPNFRRPDEILAAKPKSKLPLVALILGLPLLGAVGYWQMFMTPNTANTATPHIKKTAAAEPAEIDTSQFLPFEIEETKARLDNLGKSLRDWQLKFNAGKGLPQQSDLMPLLKQDLGLTDTDWLDAWKHPIRLQGRVQGYILVSPGLDGKTDTLDDIEFSLDL